MIRSLPTLTSYGLQRNTGYPVLGNGAGEIGQGAVHTVEPLFLERLTWGSAECRIAAAVLGDAVADQMRVDGAFVATRTPSITDYGRGYVDGMDSEALRLVVHLAREAAHYALRAIELEQTELMSIAGVTR